MYLNRQMLTIALVFVISGCLQSEPTVMTSQTDALEEIKTTSEDTMQKAAEYSYKGTIQYIGLEGGFYGIITEKGEKLLPMNLDKEYRKHGTIIHFSGNFEEGMITIQQWGKPFKLEDIKLIKIGKQNSHPDA